MVYLNEMAGGCSSVRCTDVDQVSTECKFELGCDIIAVITRKAASGGVMHYGKEIVSGYGFTKLMYVTQPGLFFFFFSSPSPPNTPPRSCWNRKTETEMD